MSTTSQRSGSCLIVILVLSEAVAEGETERAGGETLLRLSLLVPP